MIITHNIGLSFSGESLFEEVNAKFLPGNCYGLIGANGAGKSTFLKILSGEIDSTSGSLEIPSSSRISVLNQDQYAFDDYSVLHTVIYGHKKLYEVMVERDAIYNKADFTDEDGVRVGELEEVFANLDGYNAESDAASLLAQLNIKEALHSKKMKELEGGEKVKVLLAQALFGAPDILLLDEPTNHLDFKTRLWLEEFLIEFENTVIVVSHDRHFLNKVCTHIADLDYKKIQIYVGNYAFWRQASELKMQQKRDSNKKNEDKIKELEEFVRRFSANASKSKQATSRKKLIDKLKPEDIPVSSRRVPFIEFKAERPCGDVILKVDNVSKTIDGVKVLDKVRFVVNKQDKIAFLGASNLSITTLFEILSGSMEPDEGEVVWGQTIKSSYVPTNNESYFSENDSVIDWLKQYTTVDDETYVRSFLGRMLFSGDDVFKNVNVLSGGEKVRCMLSKSMLSGCNLLIMDDPTNHLDLESISSLNEALTSYKEVLLFSTHDQQFLQTVCNRVIEISPSLTYDKMGSFQDYLMFKGYSEQVV